MKTLKINKTTENFLNWSYKGDGKYYITEQGSKSYLNTIFSNFFNKNYQFCNVTERGNDAPRGGKTGDFFMVEFSKDFKSISKSFNEAKQTKIDTQNAFQAKRDTGISDDIKLACSVVDDQYKEEVAKANLLTGLNKSEARKNALASLLKRSGIEITYFYEVMRAI